MTPYELSLHLEEYYLKAKADQEERITLTYLGAYWQRVKKMPGIKEILGQESQQLKEQTPEQMLEQIKILNAVFGGTVN